MNFSPSSENVNAKLELPPELIIPLDPGSAPPPADTMPDPLRKAGACADQQAVSSCGVCVVPVDPPPVPVISTKAQKLARIMEMSCQIYNKSYAKPYVVPTHDQIYEHVLACTAELYPETPVTNAQSSMLTTLLDPSNDSLRQRMFKGIWYQPPYTDDFADYFGLENRDAAYVFCLNQNISGPLMTMEYVNAVYGDYEGWLRNPAAQARWEKAQTQRAQLLSCLNQPGTAVPAPTTPTPSTHSCEYKSFDGFYDLGGRDEIQGYLALGYKVSIETGTANKSCQQVSEIPAAGAYTGIVHIAGFKCK